MRYTCMLKKWLNMHQRLVDGKALVEWSRWAWHRLQLVLNCVVSRSFTQRSHIDIIILRIFAARVAHVEPSWLAVRSVTVSLCRHWHHLWRQRHVACWHAVTCWHCDTCRHLLTCVARSRLLCQTHMSMLLLRAVATAKVLAKKLALTLSHRYLYSLYKCPLVGATEKSK